MNKKHLVAVAAACIFSGSLAPAFAYDHYDVTNTIWTQDFEKLQKILKSNPKLAITKSEDYKEHKTRTPLCYMAGRGWLAGASLLFQYNADANVGNPPPLNIAAKAGQNAFAELLLSHGANVEGKDKQGRTALREAVFHHRTLIVNILLARGARTDMFIDAGLGRSAKIDALLTRNPGLIKAYDMDERTLMHWAASNDQQAVAELLLKRNANLNVRDFLSQTPLQAAIETHSNKMVKWLIAHGACPKKNGLQADPRDFASAGYRMVNGLWHESAIQSAVRANNLEAAQMLMDVGVSPNTKGIDGGNPLHLTVILGTTEMAELLIKAGANVNGVEDSHTTRISDSMFPDPATLYTPLHWAVYENRKDMVELLLKHHADVNARTSRLNGRRTPLDMALSANQPEIAAILRKHGGRI